MLLQKPKQVRKMVRNAATLALFVALFGVLAVTYAQEQVAHLPTDAAFAGFA